MSFEYLQRVKKIITTQYRWLIFHDSLNFKSKISPKIIVNETMQDWKILEIMNDKYYWPLEYSTKGFAGLYNEVFLPSKKNPHAYETNQIRISSSDWVIDAGACEGFFVRYALQRGAKVLAIEPVPRLAEALENTFNNEIASGDVIVLNAGLSNFWGNANINIKADEIYCSNLSDEASETISVISIDQIISRGIIPSIGFIKMDIEGAEIDALMGATETLLKFRPKLSIAVYHEYETAKYLKELISTTQPKYNIKFRGLFIRDSFGPPRPYMLHAT